MRNPKLRLQHSWRSRCSTRHGGVIVSLPAHLHSIDCLCRSSVHNMTLLTLADLCLVCLQVKDRKLASPPERLTDAREELMEAIRAEHKLRPTPGRIGT